MRIQEMLKKTGLTRKAVEYYIDQGLIVPQVQENGYREFSAEDASRLEAISAYRKLGVSIAEIRLIFSGEKAQTLNDLLIRRTLAARQQQQKDELLSLLARGADIDDIMPQLRALDAQESIAGRLLDAFPGYFGGYLMMHFSHFLADPIETPEQQEAYETIVRWADALPPMDMPDDLRNFLEEATQEISAGQMEEMHAAVLAASENPAAYLREHEDVIRKYMEIRDTEEYRASSAARLIEHMKAFQQQSGYIDVFLPAMKRLSPSYASYRMQLEKADRIVSCVIGGKTE